MNFLFILLLIASVKCRQNDFNDKPGLEYDEYDYSGRGQENPTTMLDRWTKQQPPGNDDEQQELDAKVNDKDENDPEEEYSEQNPNADDTSLEEFAQRILMDDSINPPLSRQYRQRRGAQCGDRFCDEKSEVCTKVESGTGGKPTFECTART